MKILIIPDIHGRDFWREPCEDISRWDKVIFLGDYVDPYEGEASQEDVIPNLQEIVSLKEIYKDKVILLWGNHDLFYWCEPYRKNLEYWSRHDYRRHDDIERIFIQHNNLFQFAWGYDKYLFTHAGVTNGVARLLVEEYDTISADIINDFYSKKENQMLLAMCSYYRGGYDKYGSIVWADVREHYKVTPVKEMKQFFQVFGHTYSSVRIVTDCFAMLDTGGSWAYIDDLKLKSSDNNVIEKTKFND